MEELSGNWYMQIITKSIVVILQSSFSVALAFWWNLHDETFIDETFIDETFIRSDETFIDETFIDETFIDETFINEGFIESDETFIAEGSFMKPSSGLCRMYRILRVPVWENDPLARTLENP